MSARVLRGSCLCGEIVFEVDPPLARWVYCYCSRCRKATGTGRAANLYVAPQQLRWLAGADRVSRFDLPTARSFATAVCRRCGCPVPHPTRSGRELVVPAGSLDGHAAELPAVEHCEWESRAPWVER
ncbi:MAG TPA: GFA family protein [Myxococcota bacterium]|nr:GFA family protein [Myxococcota bacterium]